MKTKLIPLVILSLFLLSNCQKKETIDFTIYLNFASSNFACGTFKVSIDGSEKMNDQLCFQGISPAFTYIKFPIESGSHIIRAELIGNPTIFEQTYELSESQKFGYLNYNNDNSEFSFRLSATGGID